MCKDIEDWTDEDWQEFRAGFYEPVRKSGGEVDNPVFNVTDKPLIQSEVIKGSSSGTISCDTEQTKERKSSDLEPEVDCDHLWLTKAGADYRFKFVELCAKCGGEQ